MFTVITLFFTDKFDYKELEEANPIFAPIIFMSFTIIVVFMLVSFMITIILDGFALVTVSMLVIFSSRLNIFLKRLLVLLFFSALARKKLVLIG